MAGRPDQALGLWAEALVLQHLQQLGWRCLDQRWRCRWGELDLVLAKPGRLLVVEVKARRRRQLDAGGLAAFDGPKRRRLARSLRCWQAAHPAWAAASVQVHLALVQPPGRVRWLAVDHLG
ncbi:MAG: YraN family protein [Synechococcus sp.]|nr:YraN family protein [Synechococcus sp.]